MLRKKADKTIQCIPAFAGATTFTVEVDGNVKGEIEHVGEGVWTVSSYGRNRRAETNTYSNKRKAARALA